MQTTLTPKLCPDDLIPLRDAARLIPSYRMGRPVHVSCVLRWAKSGRLQLYKCGSGYRVSLSELRSKFGPRPA